MLLSGFFLFLLFSDSFHLVFANDHVNEDDFPNDSKISRDVCIIGGGSAGTYAAIRLKQLGRTVAVVEREAVLGGHTNTYIDPITHTPVDYGVQLWDDIPVVTNYFSYFNIPLITINVGVSPFVTEFADFSAGHIIPNNLIPQGNLPGAIQTYIGQLSNYTFIDNGFNLPSPVPADLLLSFGDFVEKYNLQDLAYTAYLYTQGSGNVLAQLALYIIKGFSPLIVEGILNGFLTTASHDNHELYDKALTVLGSDAFVSSTVQTVERSNGRIKAVIWTPSGKKLIKAKKLLITIPPKLENLQFLDLDKNERGLFGLFNHSYYWNGVIRNSGIPDNTSISSLNPQAPYGIPPQPGIFSIQATGVPGLHVVFYGSTSSLSTDQVKSNILADITKVVNSAGFPAAPGPAEVVAFADHSPFRLTAPVDAIKNGFYNHLNALQGKSETWWTGATWQTHDSALIWNFTEYNILPQLS
jgi:hypothetical protein